MDSTLIAGIIGSFATVLAAVIGLLKKSAADRMKLKLNELVSKEVRQPMLIASEYGIKVVTPEEYSKQEMSFQVSGTYENLPEGQVIWTATFDFSDMTIDGHKKRVKRYWPQSPANVQEKKWYSRINHIGGATGETREYLILITGRDGQSLFKYYTEAGDINHNWPPITQLTGDVVECATSKIIVI